MYFIFLPKHTESFWPGFKWRMTAHRLAMTEQSVVMSWTRSQSVRATMMFSYSSGPESRKMSAGRFQPSKISCCLSEKENSAVSLSKEEKDKNQHPALSQSSGGGGGLYVKGGSSSLLLRKTAGSGSASQGKKTLPCSLEERSRMVFSLVGSWRVWRGPLGLGGGLEEAGAGGGAGAVGVLRVSARAMSS